MMDSALRQYTDLFRQHRDLIDSQCAAPLNALRDKAAAAIEAMTLPEKGSEDYHITSLREMLAPDWGVNLARVPMRFNPAESFRCGVPNLSTAQIYMFGDTCVVPEGSGIPSGQGVFAGSLAQAAREMPDTVARHYGRLADLGNPVAALNTMLCQDGVMIYVPDGVRLERPLQLVSILRGDQPMMAVRRVLLVLGKGSEAKLLMCDHTQGGGSAGLMSLQVIEAYAGEGSTLDIYDIEESSERTSRLSSIYLRQQARSNVLLDGITLYNGTTRNEYRCDLDGEQASLRLMGLAIEDRDRHADTYSCIRHNAPRCKTDELFKYVIDDTARGSFAGLIYVAPGAVKTEAYQSNRNVVGSPQARMYSKPQLEIYNDDVKCSHGTATGTFDDSQLFYMNARGLSDRRAKLLLKQAFMADVIDGVRLPALGDRLRQLVERRFAGEEGHSCATCMADCPTAK